jgi:hypothetical protein
MFFRFPLMHVGTPSALSSSSGSALANMRVWCGFPGACSKSCYRPCQDNRWLGSETIGRLRRCLKSPTAVTAFRL